MSEFRTGFDAEKTNLNHWTSFQTLQNQFLGTSIRFETHVHLSTLRFCATCLLPKILILKVSKEVHYVNGFLVREIGGVILWQKAILINEL
jgi:hypothetical protein